MNQRREPSLNRPALIPVAGNYDRKPRSLDRDVTTIGRARGSDLCLEANEISTLHCIIYHAADGFRVRDCNSRTGTRVNGDSVKTHALHDGDIINLGPFSFEIRIPQALFPKDGARLDPVRVAHWHESRRKLALRALKLRERLRNSQHGSISREQELTHKANILKEKIRSYDHRLSELEDAEQELTEEREKLAREKEAHSAHVQQVEKTLADRLAQADAEIRQRWQEFQQRCQAEETRLHQLALTGGTNVPAPSAEAGGAPQQDRLEFEKRLQEADQRLAQQHDQLETERQEFLAMKSQWVQDQTQSASHLDEQKSALAQQEAAVRAQKAELVRMMGDLKKMQEDLRKQAKPDVRALQLDNERLHQENAHLQAQLKSAEDSAGVDAILQENDELRERVRHLQEHAAQAAPTGAGNGVLKQMEEMQAEIELLNEELKKREAEVEEFHHANGAAPGDSSKEMEHLRAENQLYKKLLEEKDHYVQEKSQEKPAAGKNENDLERYEAELNEYRRQLETDRSKLNKEVEMLRERNAELDEAIREMEMEMSKERAELARERTRLERVRDETKADMERLQREIAVRDSMAPVHKLREELVGKQPPSNGKPDKALNDRLRSMRNQLTDSPS